MSRRLWSLIGLVSVSAATASLLACGEANLKTLTPTPPPDGGPITTFKAGVFPTLAARDCTNVGCHIIEDPPAPASGLGLGGPGITSDQVYASIMAGGSQNGTAAGLDVNVAAPEDSLMLDKPLEASGVGHGGGKQFAAETDIGYLSIRGWIESGAPNN